MSERDHFRRAGYTKPSSIDDEEHSRVGDVSTGRPFKAVQEVPTKELIDAVDADTTYIGESKQGTATSSALWRIYKVSTSSTVTTIAFADGNDLYDNIWDDRASLSYS